MLADRGTRIIVCCGAGGVGKTTTAADAHSGLVRGEHGRDPRPDARRERVDAYNDALRRVAASHGVPCLPLHNRLAALLPPGHPPPPFSARTGPMFSGWLIGHLILRRPWSEVGRRRGPAVLTDNVHLSEPAAATIAGLIEGFLGPDRGTSEGWS